jgi:hypothetical protein
VIDRRAGKHLTEGAAIEVFDLPRAEALDKIVQGLLDPIDLTKPGQVETLVDRFLHSPSIRRRLNAGLIDDDWVKLKSFEEHAKWIRDERQLVDLLGKDFSRQLVMADRPSGQRLYRQGRDSEARNFRCVDGRGGAFRAPG